MVTAVSRVGEAITSVAAVVIIVFLSLFGFFRSMGPSLAVAVTLTDDPSPDAAIDTVAGQLRTAAHDGAPPGTRAGERGTRGRGGEFDTRTREFHVRGGPRHLGADRPSAPHILGW